MENKKTEVQVVKKLQIHPNYFGENNKVEKTPAFINCTETEFHPLKIYLAMIFNAWKKNKSKLTNVSQADIDFLLGLLPEAQIQKWRETYNL